VKEEKRRRMKRKEKEEKEKKFTLYGKRMFSSSGKSHSPR